MAMILPKEEPEFKNINDIEKVTYDDWASWDEKVWRSFVCNMCYPADYEDDWPIPWKDPKVCYGRIAEPPGPHWRNDVKGAHWDEFFEYVKNEEKWILVEPYLVADTAGRWIEVGNILHHASVWTGLISLITQFVDPHKYKWHYRVCTLISVVSCWGYYKFLKDPISKYQLSWSRRELNQFPMRSFYPMKPHLFKKVPNIYRRISNRIISISCFVWTMYHFLYPAPPCYCGWAALEKFKPDDPDINYR